MCSKVYRQNSFLTVFNLKYEEGRDTVVGCSMAAERAKRMSIKKKLLDLIPTCGRYKIEEGAVVEQPRARFPYSGFLRGTSPCSTGTLVTLKTTGRSESGQL